jgi:hypothetical protein
VLPQKPTGKGALSDVPVGIKDIIETRGLPTDYGAPIYKDRMGGVDAGNPRAGRDGTGSPWSFIHRGFENERSVDGTGDSGALNSMPVGDALPLGLQLTAAPGDDARVLHTAVRIYRLLTASGLSQ